MTDRINGYFVVLEDSVREDDVQPVLNAIRQIRGVIGVTPQIQDSFSETAGILAERNRILRLIGSLMKGSLSWDYSTTSDILAIITKWPAQEVGWGTKIEEGEERSYYSGSHARALFEALKDWLGRS